MRYLDTKKSEDNKEISETDEYEQKGGISHSNFDETDYDVADNTLEYIGGAEISDIVPDGLDEVPGI